MERIYFKTELEYCPEEDVEVFEADNASGYFEANEFHAVGEYHYVYKFDGQAGWYMKNQKDGIDRYLCGGACPTLPVENLTILNEEVYTNVTIDLAELSSVEETVEE